MNKNEFEAAVVLELKKLSEIIGKFDDIGPDDLLSIAVTKDGYVSSFMFDRDSDKLIFEFVKSAKTDWSDIIEVKDGGDVSN